MSFMLPTLRDNLARCPTKSSSSCTLAPRGEHIQQLRFLNHLAELVITVMVLGIEREPTPTLFEGDSSKLGIGMKELLPGPAGFLSFLAR